MEASGLGSASFPTEIGWALVRDGGAAESGSVLIRPPARWTMYTNAWSPASETLTGITREMLDRGVCRRKTPLSDFWTLVGVDLTTAIPSLHRRRGGAKASGPAPGTTQTPGLEDP
jgi:hypothetical protein